MFVNLHTHDAFGSLLDSIIKPNELAEFASKNGQIAIASTNHGYMSSFVEFHKACLKNNVKPIHGCEIYECDNDTEKADTKDYKQARYHLVLLAKNKAGLQNLFKIVSFACTDGFYKKPLITIDRIKENGWGKGIVCLTACQAGRFSRLIADENYAELQNYIEKNKDCFDDTFCEIQAHKTPDQALLNRKIVDFAHKNHLKTVVTTDAHMLSPEQSDSHAIFVEIGEGREVGETYADCYLQTEDEVRDKLSGCLTDSEINEAISNTELIANSIELIDIGLTDKAVMPKVEIEGDFDSHEEYLRYLVYKTFDEKFGHLSKEEQDKRRQRIEEELPVLFAVNYTDYFIMLYMLIDAFRKANIPLGYARGSAAGSLCLYMLNVTQIDSVRWKLDFSRFANLGRTSMADCDIDISRKKRRLAVDITADLFGRDKVAPICTFNSLSTKVAIRDVGKVLNEKESSPYFGKIPYSLRDEVAKMIPTIKTLNDLGEEEDKDTLLRDVLLKNEKLQEVYEQFPLWFKHVMAVEGLPKSMGRHAAGTLITPEPIVTYCPTCYDADKNVMVQLEMHSAMDDLNLIKMDLLGLKTVDCVDDTLKFAGLTWSDVDINHLNLDDDMVFKEVYQTGNTIGIFQMESYEARRMCIESKADDIENVVVVNAANRPGTKDSFPEYCQNKLNPELENPIHPDLRKIFKASHGVLLYQEQALQIFRYAGFPESEVDNARRCVDENTLITMGDGSQKKIKDIVVGDTVISLSNNGSFVPKKVTAVFDNGVKPTSILKTKHEYSLIATENHKVFTDSGWKEIKDVDKNISLFTPTNIKTNWADIAGNKKPSDSDMFLIGLLIGDGSIGNEDAVHFTNSEDVVIKRFVSCLSNIGNKSYKATYNISAQDGVGVEKIYSIYPTELCKNRLLQLLKKYNLIHFAGDKNIPNEFLSYAPTSKIKNLLGGLFNTDGGYCESQSAIEYYTKSKILALQIKYLLLKYGIYSYVYSKRANGYNYEVFTLRISDPTSLVKFGEEIVPFVCGRKKDDYIRMIDISNNNDLKYNYMLPLSCSKEILNSILESNKSISEIATQCGYNENSLKISSSFKLTDTKARRIIQHLYCPNTYKILSSDVRPIEIVSKSEYGYSHVYDIEVEDTHNYVANGLVVHNCIGKKDAKRMTDLQTRLIDGLKAKGWSDEQCSVIWDLLLKQSNYSFNRCISGDTRLYRDGAKQNAYIPTIAEMFKLKHDLQYAKDTGHVPLRSKYLNTYGTTLSLCDDGRIRKNKIVDIYYSGYRETFKITLESGKSICCTENHKFPTSDGEKYTFELNVGDGLFVKGEYDKKFYVQNLTDGNYKHNYPQKGQCGFQKNTNGASVIFKREKSKHSNSRDCCEICGAEYGSTKFELHHIDGDRTNNDTSNYQWLCCSCHKKIHYRDFNRIKRGQKGCLAHIEKIISIESNGYEDVYDVEMADPNHNFVIDNGIVTSNSHAVAYGLLSYLTAYLKIHYPVEFMAACLTNDSDNVSKISVFVNESKRIGINVLPPHINRSEKYFTPLADKNQILFGLLAIKGLGESAIDNIMSMRPYNGVEDVFSKVQNRSATISLIKAGAIPTKDKMKLMRRYAEWCYTPLQYKEVSSLPTKSKLLLDWNIDVEQYKADKKVDKERVLQVYNGLRKKQFDESNALRQKSFMDDFYNKYAKDEFLWEFETLSMFVTHDPLCEANQYMTVQWNDVPEGEVGVVVAVVIDIERKKDKNGNLFLYIDLYTPFGIIESTCWGAQTKQYGSLIKKCSCLAIRGRKAEGGHLFVEDIKPYEQWLKDRKIKLERR